MENTENKAIIVLPDVVAKQAFLKLEGSENSVLIDGDKAEGAFRKQLTSGNIDENCDCYQIISSSIDEVCQDEEKANLIKEKFKEKYKGSLSSAINPAFKEVYKDSGKSDEEISKMAAKVWANYATETNIKSLQAELAKPENEGKDIVLVLPPKIAANNECVKKIQDQLRGKPVEFVKCFGPTDYESFKLAAMESNAFTNHFTEMKNILLKNYANDDSKKQEIEANYTILMGKDKDNQTEEAKIEAKKNMFKILEEKKETEKKFEGYLVNELKDRQNGISNVANNIQGIKNIDLQVSPLNTSGVFNSFANQITQEIPSLQLKNNQQNTPTEAKNIQSAKQKEANQLG